MSPKHDQEYFADGVAEEILNALAQVEGLKVIGPDLLLLLQGQAGRPQGHRPEARRRERARGKPAKGRERHPRHGASSSGSPTAPSSGRRPTTGSSSGIFKVQDEIAKAVVGALKVKLAPRGAARPGARSTRDPEAYRLFLLGRSLVIQGSEESTRRAIATLDRALAIDPGMGQGHAWLSTASWNLSLVTSGEERRALLRRDREAADRAVTLAPDDAIARAARGLARMMLDWDWKGAQADLERAVELGPRDGTVINAMAILESTLGRRQAALALERRAVELDPLAVIHVGNLAWDYLDAGDLAQARTQARRALEIQPGAEGARALLAYADLLEGKATDALLGLPADPGEAPRPPGNGGRRLLGGPGEPIARGPGGAGAGAR